MAENLKPVPSTELSGVVARKRKKLIFGITKATWGGAQRYVFDLATNLPQDRFEIIVIGGVPGLLKEKIESAGMRFIEIEGLGRDISLVKEFKAFLQITRIIKKEKPHILHLNSPKMAGLGALAGRLLGVKKIIVTVHGWSFLEKRFFAARCTIAIFSWLTAILTSKTIILTKRDLRSIKHFPFIGRERYQLIHNGVNANETALGSAEARKKLSEIIARQHKTQPSALDEPIWLGTIAELTLNKDLATLVRAAASLPLLTPLVIIGDGDERTHLAELIKELKAENKIFLAGFAPQAAKLLPAFTVFILSSVKEGLPYVLLEAGRCGLPAIATKVGGVPDIIEDGISGILVNPQSPDELQEAITQLLGDAAKRKRMGALLQKKIGNHFQITSMIKQTLAAYGEQAL